MRPEAIRKALLEAENRPSVVQLNDGTRLRIRSREHWLIGPEFLYVVVGNDVHHVAFRNVITIRYTRSRGRKSTG